MENRGLTCCFTGYRPSKFPFTLDKANKDYINFENSLYREIFSAYSCGVKTFVSGMAMGFDIIAAETVLSLKKAKSDTKLVCAIPFREQAKDFPLEWQNRYFDILKSADEIIYVCESYNRGCYFKRNKYMVDNSDIVITWFNGQKGGTANTIDYAMRKGRKVINLNTVTVKPRFKIKSFRYLKPNK